MRLLGLGTSESRFLALDVCRGETEILAGVVVDTVDLGDLILGALLAVALLNLPGLSVELETDEIAHVGKLVEGRIGRVRADPEGFQRLEEDTVVGIGARRRATAATVLLDGTGEVEVPLDHIAFETLLEGIVNAKVPDHLILRGVEFAGVGLALLLLAALLGFNPDQGADDIGEHALAKVRGVDCEIGEFVEHFIGNAENYWSALCRCISFCHEK